MQELRLKFPLKVLLKIANIPYSSFYYHLKNKDGFLCKHKALVKQIQEIYHAHRGRYGYRRITLTINKIRKEKNQKQVNHKTVLKILKELGLKSFTRLKKYNSYKGVKNKAVDNILNREFQAQAPNEKWATDVTEFKVNGDKIFLSPIIDLFNGEIISYSLTKSPSVSAINNMLKKAYKVLSKKDRVILHSDQGWQYTMDNYKLALRKNNIIQSMSRKGNCYDNAIIGYSGLICASDFGVLVPEISVKLCHL
ncbi:IS3 family transposase, partial [Myroides pelagicus]|uniref:IS3 family transposase n=1 Tax=Myroides pelagicus TaxID=270914 RepID=UPI002DBF4929